MTRLLIKQHYNSVPQSPGAKKGKTMTDATTTSMEPPLRPDFHRDLPLSAPLSWLKSGIQDTFKSPASSLVYGFAIFVISIITIGGLFLLGYDYILLPALSGFMVMGPAIAVGLYEKSQQLAEGKKPRLVDMIMVHARSPGQILFIGVILMLVVMLWLRAAFLLYALFFGMIPFSGFDQVLSSVFTTPHGWALLVVGTATGGLFAAFSFAISAFSIPMLMHERKDALTAMGISMAMAWANKKLAIVWGAIVVVLFAISILTALVGLIIVFPILGHATWHAYLALRGDVVIDEVQDLSES